MKTKKQNKRNIQLEKMSLEDKLTEDSIDQIVNNLSMETVKTILEDIKSDYENYLDIIKKTSINPRLTHPYRTRNALRLPKLETRDIVNPNVEFKTGCTGCRKRLWD